MSTREQFGPYLLLKKLTEDGLGETFRAGKVVQGAIDRVALLRVFNGRGLDARGLLDRIASRRKLGEILSGPNIMTAVDIGEAQGTPYVAYDYVAGKDLASLLDQATAKRSPFPTDHALLVAERVSQALAMAGETKIEGNRVLHGFVVPQFVRISNEGETRLLGFESGPALRGLLSNPALAKPFARYLAPEALGGAAPARSDDVYSLGVLLFELLAGEMLPSPSASGYADLIDRASLAADGSPLPSEIAGLLKRSLAAKEQRIPDALTWHKALSKMMYEGQYNPTTFNLAFFMHNLFRSEIERETQELQVEKTLKIPAQTAAAPPPAKAAAPAAAPAAPAEGSGVRQDTLAVRERYGIEGEEAKKKSTGLIAAVAAIVVLGGLAAGYFFWYRKGPGAAGPAEQPAPATATQMPATSPVASGTSNLTEQSAPNAKEQAGTNAAGGTAAGTGGETTPQASSAEAAAKESQADLQAQISKIVEERMKATEKGISAKYDQQIQALQKQLAEAKKAAALQEQKAAKEKANTPPVATKQAPAGGESKVAANGSAEAHPSAQNAGVNKSSAAGQQAAAAPASPSAGGSGTAAAQAPTESARTPAQPPKPQAPQIHRGDLVSPGTPGFVAPRKVFEKQPIYPPVAKRFGKRATVVLSVLVDDSGRVQQTKLLSKPASFGFDRAAMEAARQTRWEPATVHGIPVKTWVEVRVVFEPPQN